METQLTSFPDAEILVTGATGLAGSSVIREFIRMNHPVRVLVRDINKAKALLAFPNVQIVEGDMTFSETLNDALKGIKKVLMISSSTSDMAETQKSFIDAAKAAGVAHIIKFSGLSAADLDSTFVFAGLHKEAETYLENSGLAWTHLRPSQFMTEYLRELPTIIAHQALFLPFKDARLVPVDPNDIAKAAFALLTTDGHEGKVYAISGPESLNMHEVASYISDAILKPVAYVDVPLEQRAQALLQAGIPPFFVEALSAQATERWKGMEAVVHQETHEVLGIKSTTFNEFVKRNAGAFLGESTYVGF